MTPNEQNKAIAEYCGWTEVGMVYNRYLAIEQLAGEPPKDSNYAVGQPSLIPNYHSDLNAMHEAEKKLPSTEPREGEVSKSIYLRKLSLITGNYAWDMTHATSSQRAEAFLKTIGKWKE
jgi:hypothetical protein